MLEKEARRERIDNLYARDNKNKVDAQELVNKLRDEYQKDLDLLGGAREEERERQFEVVKAQLAERKARVEEARRLKEEEDNRKAEEARLEKEKEIDRIKSLRAKKAQLEKTLAEG